MEVTMLGEHGVGHHINNTPRKYYYDTKFLEESKSVWCPKNSIVDRE